MFYNLKSITNCIKTPISTISHRSTVFTRFRPVKMFETIDLEED